tara:strand:- start:645 stop:965 length:321 start_codon:yes stop_codon:yes gene_type:complete
MENNCDPTYGLVDEILELLTKSKSLHILLVLDRKKDPIRFSKIKKLVESSSTTVSRRLKELEAYGLVSKNELGVDSNMYEYSITEEGLSLSPIMQSLFDWVADRVQ